MCVSRPTSSTGNILTDTEIRHLSKLAKQYGTEFFIDNAYGRPFPNIVFTEDATPVWDESIVLSMRLSKVGLTALRTGIVVAPPKIARAVSNLTVFVIRDRGCERSKRRSMPERPLACEGERPYFIINTEGS